MVAYKIKSLFGTAAIIILLTLAIARLPRQAATSALDPSWCAVLQYAAQQHLASGSDIVFTYGPLGHHVTPVYAGGDIYARMFFEFVFVFLNIVPLVLVARNMEPRWRSAMYGLLILGPVLLVTGKDCLVQFGILWWGLLCFTAPIRAVGFAACGLALFAALCGLIKFSWFVLGAGTCAAVLADLMLRRAWWPAFACIATAVAAFLGGGLFQGLKLADLLNYLNTSASVASGYAGAMGIRCPRGTLVLGIGLLSSTCGAILTTGVATTRESSRVAAVRRVLVSLWLLGMVFLGWKYGFVRADVHVVTFGMFAGVVPLALLALPASSARFAVLRKSLALISVGLAMVLCESNFPGSILSSPRAAAGSFGHSVDSVVRPGRYAASLAALWRESCESLSLPAVRKALQDDSVDVFGWRQTYAIANDLNYTPRPVFQSYCAYNRDLSARNAAFYRSSRAPEWVLFDLAAIDGRLPSLEDSSCLIEILCGYRFVESAEPFLLLKNRHNAPTRKLTLLRTGTCQVGRRVDLGEYSNNDLWAEVDVDVGLVSRVEATVLRPAALRISLHCDSAHPETAKPEDVVFNAPVAMLSSGFLMSPLVSTNEDVKQVMMGGAGRRVNGFTLEPTRRSSTLRRSGFTFRVYAIDPGLTH